LRSTATTLKNRLLAGVTPYQCTSAGAYQKASDTGSSRVLTHSAARKRGSSMRSADRPPPPPTYIWANWPPSISADTPTTHSTASA
jgi:hypothetical protein